MFQRVAIVNRGEAAMRLVRAVRELALDQRPGLVSIALFTEAERGAMFVRQADEAVRLESRQASAYLDYDAIESALLASQADAVWVGWGFVAEDPTFADRIERLGITFIGPTGDMMRQLGNKIGAKLLAERCGVPVAPWSGGPVADAAQAAVHASAIGYPLMVKAAGGGGGRGIRRVEEAGQLADAFEAARREAASTFGDGTVFLERVLLGARHVEVQVVADGQGRVWTLGVRDCSVQRRHQKVIEESSSPVLSPEAEHQAMDHARALAEATGYRGAATVELLYQPASGAMSFLEVNTRLQVEHTVTEAVTGVDLVKLQLHVAGGGRLDGDAPTPRGHAIEVRLNAEDPQQDFAPAPGRVQRLVWGSGPGVRVDTGVAQGDLVPAEYDSMIAKIIGVGQDRSEARVRVLRALHETTIVISGGTTNKAFLADLLAHPDVIAGQVDTSWLDRLTDEGGYRPSRQLAVALIATALDVYEERHAVERQRFVLSAARGRPQADMSLGQRVELRTGPTRCTLDVHQVGPGRYRVMGAGRRLGVSAEHVAPFERRVVVEGHSYRVVTSSEGGQAFVEVDGLAHRIWQDDGCVVRAPSPGVLVELAVAQGEEVRAGDRLGTLESMKMEVVLRAPLAGRVRAVLVALGSPVESGIPLVQIDTTSAPVAPAGSVEPPDFEALRRAAPGDPRRQVLDLLSELGAQMLGYDYPAAQARRIRDAYHEARRQVAVDDPDVVRAELGVLDAFADIARLSRNRRTGSDSDEEEVHSPRELFHAFLATMDPDRSGLPAGFQDKLRTALARYQVGGLEPSSALEDAVLRIFVAQEQADAQVPAVLAVLSTLRGLPVMAGGLGSELLECLERLVLATQLRHPAVGELARSVRFRLFDRPAIDAARQAVLEEMTDHLSALAAGCTPEERSARMEALVACPVPLIRLMAALGAGRDEERRELIEVQTRRYYGPSGLDGVRRSEPGGRRVVIGTFRDGGAPVEIGAVEVASTAPEELAGALEVLEAELARTTAASGAPAAVADLYVLGHDTAGLAGHTSHAVQSTSNAVQSTSTADATSARIARALAARPEHGGLRQVTVSVPAGDRRVERFTFVRRDDGFAEELLLRDLHPMIADRLHLWRLAAFDLKRLPAHDDVYLFEATARSNPADRRLMALAEVRDLTALRDASGALSAMPALEQVFDSCVDSMRRAIRDLGPGRAPQWNRIVLHVRPIMDLAETELHTVVRSLAPRTDGLGLEQVGVQGRLAGSGGARPVRLRLTRQPGSGLSLEITPSPTAPLRPLDAYGQKVLQAMRRGTVYPYELVPLLVRAPGAPPGSPPGRFVEHDLDDLGRAVAVERPYGENTSAIVFGTVSTPTSRYPEGITRVALFGDPTKALGSVAEPECRRIMAALDLADELGAPVEWFAVCSGAKIAMDSGTENMDWVARVLRRLIERTQAGGEVNVVVTGINVGAQPYWNAEATMLMHTKGILVMTPDSAMVLTGKKSLEYSGAVAAEDNFGIGGYDRIMGPNGQAQYWATDVADACRVLHAHYELTYVAPGERFPRHAQSSDPTDRDVRLSPHHAEGSEFASIGDIFSDQSNPERKKPFDIRSLMHSVVDHDVAPLERWAAMRGAETAVVLDACLGGYRVALLGIESRGLPRLGVPPADGPGSWSGGTLYPKSSKKLARAINAASGSRPLVVLANLSGFDGSPESMRELQLEYGAEIGRAIVNFDGPIVFCVVSRYHGGAFVVFSAALNDRLEVAAVEGSYASVIGGGPAAAVVFTAEVNRRTEADPRVAELAAHRPADDGEAASLRSELEQLRAAVRLEKQAEVADEFDRVHNIERAKAMGSVHTIIPAARLRPYLIEAVDRGMAKLGDGSGDARLASVYAAGRRPQPRSSVPST